MANTNRTPTVGSLTAAGVVGTVTNPLVTLVTPLVGALFLGFTTLIQPSAASLTVSGVASTALQGTVRPPTVGALAATGVAGRLDQAFPSTVGSLTLTGIAPPVGRGSPTGAGSLTLTGAAPSLLPGNAITPTVASLTLTGAASRLDLGMAPPVGSLVLTGQGALTAAVRTPVTGALALTGTIGPTGITITPPVVALALTGAVPTVAGVPTLALTPPSGSAFFGIFAQITPDPGSLVLAGVAPAVSRSQQWPTLTGSLTLAGSAPSLDSAHAVQPSATSLTLTGTTPSLSTGAQIAVTPNAGVLVLGDPAVSGVFPFPGALALTGAAPGVVGQGPSSVTPTVGSLVINGQLGGATNTRITPVSADLDSSSAPPGLQQDTPRGPTAGSLTLAGVAPSVGVAGANATGVLTLTGLVPVLTITAPSYTPTVGALTLTGVAPGVSQSNQTVVQTPTGALVLTGVAPTLDLRIVPPVGSLALTGVAGLAMRGIVPTTGALALTGNPPGLVNPTTATPGSGALVLQGFAGVTQGPGGARRRLWDFPPMALPIGPTHVRVI